MIDSNLKYISLFKDCEPAFFEELEAHAQRQSHEKGKILFIHGDKAERFYFIKNGWVKLFRETLDGAQAIVDILPAGHIFGEISIFEDGIYSYSAETAGFTDVISFSLAHLKAEIESNNKLALNMLSSMARYRRRQYNEIEHISIQNAAQRIGCFLLRLADQNKTGAVTIHLPYEKTLVASRLGMQPETFSRALSRLRNETGICIKGATIEMDSFDQLVNYSCPACSLEFPCKAL